MSKEEAMRVIDLVKIVQTCTAAKEKRSTLPENVVDLDGDKYQIGRAIVWYKGGIDYEVNGVIPVKAFRDGTYGIHDLRVDSEGNRIRQISEK